MIGRTTLVGLVLAWSLPAWGASIKASSELQERDGTRHPASLAVDGLLSTGWAEAEPGTGEGSWLELRLDRTTDISSVSIWPGDLRRGERSLKENGRPHTVTVQLLDGATVVAEQEVRVRDGATQGAQRIDVPIEGTARSVKVVIDQAYAGFLYNDTYLAEVAVNFAAGGSDDPGGIEAWLASSRGKKAADDHAATVIGLFDRIVTSDLGDRDALSTLLDWAGDGAPFLRERVSREVPAGSRVKALPPDEMSITALLKLKDPNAVPALTLATLRTTGDAQARLRAAVSYFDAYGELKGGGRRSLPLWGTEGWERGALRSFGEPMGTDVGSDGSVYVADVANHRVTVFSPEGSVSRVLGRGEPTITSTWFGKDRRHYVSGREPSDQAGGFTNPLDLDVFEGASGDELLVLDAEGWLQWLDASGRPLKRWKVRADLGPRPGVGGAGFVRLVKKQIVVIWGNEVIVYSLDGEEVGRFTIEDGAPITVGVAKNGRLTLGFRSSAADYSLDGYRFGTVLDELPLGTEGWDLTYDDRGKLWVVTDNGWAIKYKKPGKEDYRIRWVNVGVVSPRFAVRDDVLYAAGSGQVRKIDALQTRLDAEAADAEAAE